MIARVGKFIKSYFFHAPFFVVTYSYAFLLKNFSFTVKFFLQEQIKSKIREGKSMIRIGDGEVHLMLGGDLSYQKYNNKIDNALRESIRMYTDKSPYILGINELVMDKRNDFLKKKNKFYLWLPMKVYYFLYFNKDAVYFDASLFYYDGVFDNLFKEYLTDKKLVIVTTKENIEMFKKTTYNSSVIEYIESCQPNPHDSYKKITTRLDLYHSRKDVVIFLSSGPTSKVIAYQYCEKIQCIDIGIGLEVLFGRQGLVSLLEM